MHFKNKTVFKRAMNFRDLLSKGPQKYFTPFLTCFLNSNSIPSHLDINLSGISPAQVAFGTRHLGSGSQLPNSRIRIKMNQILSIILINTSNLYSFCPSPLLHVTTSLVSIRQADGQCRVNTGSAGRACSVW